MQNHHYLHHKTEIALVMKLAQSPTAVKLRPKQNARARHFVRQAFNPEVLCCRCPGDIFSSSIQELVCEMQ